MAQFLPRAEVIVVTTPQPAAQRVAQRAAYMAQKVNLDVIGVIENMSWFRGDDGKSLPSCSARAAGRSSPTSSRCPLLGQVPLVPQLREGADDGRPIVVTDPDDEASLAFLADRRAPRRRARAQARLPHRAQDHLGAASAGAGTRWSSRT